jgi:hypothetical protein
MMMETGYWHTNALLALCLDQKSSPFSKAWGKTSRIAVWWGAAIEAHWALEQLKMKGVSNDKIVNLQRRFNFFYLQCGEVLPTERLRNLSVGLMERFRLRPPDVIHLAAALVWCFEKAEGRSFVCFEGDLAEAARSSGFLVLTECKKSSTTLIE